MDAQSNTTNISAAAISFYGNRGLPSTVSIDTVGAVEGISFKGTPLPRMNSAQAFSPGVGVDMLVAVLSVPLLLANLWAVRSVWSQTGA